MYVIVLLLVGLLFFAVYASACICSGLYVKVQCRAEKSKPQVALTFDDGPDPVQTPKVLDVLRENKVQATFFCIGNRAEKYPDIVRRIIDEGHRVGNHSYAHTNRFPLLGGRKMEADLARCNRILEHLTGETISIFRPPFGVTNPTIARVAKQGGFKVIGWSIRSFDTLNGSQEKVVNRISRKLHNGGIILLHDDRDSSEVLLQMVIHKIRARKFEIERLDKIGL